MTGQEHQTGRRVFLSRALVAGAAAAAIPATAGAAGSSCEGGDAEVKIVAYGGEEVLEVVITLTSAQRDALQKSTPNGVVIDQVKLLLKQDKDLESWLDCGARDPWPPT